MNINHILQTCTMIRWRWNSNTSHTCVCSVYQALLSPFRFTPFYSAMGTRLGGAVPAKHEFHYKNFKNCKNCKPLIDFINNRQEFIT